MTPRELEVFHELIAVLDGTMTKLGHPYQQVWHESMGLCSPITGCGDTCYARRDLFIRATNMAKAATAAHDAAQPHLLEG